MIREGGRIISFLEIQKLVVIGLMIGFGYTLVRGPELIAENVGIMTRASQEESERNRELIRQESSANREANSVRDNRFLEAFRAESERNRTATDALLKLALTSLTAMSKDMGRLGLLINQLTEQVTKLEQAIIELKKKLIPSEVQLAPAPRIKVRSTLSEAGFGDDNVIVHSELPLLTVPDDSLAHSLYC